MLSEASYNSVLMVSSQQGCELNAPTIIPILQIQ